MRVVHRHCVCSREQSSAGRQNDLNVSSTGLTASFVASRLGKCFSRKIMVEDRRKTVRKNFLLILLDKEDWLALSPLLKIFSNAIERVIMTMGRSKDFF